VKPIHSFTAILLLIAVGLWFVLSQRDPSVPPAPHPSATNAPSASESADPIRVATSETARPPDAAAERSNALPVAPSREPAITVTGVVLGDHRAPDLSSIRIVAFRGNASDEAGSLMPGMNGARSITQHPAFAPGGEPIATAAVDATGHFELHTDERHLRLRLEDDLYVLPMPEIVHVASTATAAEAVLSPLLGGCLHGRLLGERLAEAKEVRLLLDADPMSMMRDSRLFLGAMLAASRPTETPDAEGAFTFRGVLPGSPITLSAFGPHSSARATQPALAPGERRDVVLLVRNAASLEVTVTDTQGKALASVSVAVRSMNLTGMTVPQLLARRAETAADGTCVIPGLAAERSRVEATARGFTAFSTMIDLQAGDEPQALQITLDEGGVVEGTVLSPDDKPLADAHVAHQPSIDVPMLGDMSSQLGSDHLAMVAQEGVVTDAEGHFRLTGLADEGEFLVIAAHPDYSVGITRGVKMNDRSVKVTMQPVGSLQGRATVAADEPPLGTFTVTVLRTAFLIMRTPVRQEVFDGTQGGAFSISHIAPGSYTLQVSAEGHSDVQKDIEIKAGELDVGELQLPRAATIAGTVQDEDGKPVAFALVRRRQGAMADNPMMAMFSGGSLQARSDAQGHFHLAPMPPGRLQLLASAEGFASGRSERLQLTAGQELGDVVITLGHGGSIQGKLVVGAGQQQDEFLLMAQEQGTQASHMATIEADGTFTLHNLDPGQYTVQAMPQDLMRGLGQGQTDWKPGQGMKFGGMFQKLTEHVVSQRCTVRAGETSEVTLDASEVAIGMRWTLRVQVGGKPLSNGMVEATTLADGRVRIGILQDGAAVFGGMHAGAQRIQVRSGMTMAPIGQPQSIELPEGTDTFRSSLSLPGGELHGRVVDATTGEPLRSALVRLLHDGKSENDDALGMALTDGDGAFRFPGLADGDYSLIAAEGMFTQKGTASRRDGIHVTADQAGETIELRAQPAAAASVLVTTSGGNPIAGATVLCVDAAGHPLGALGLATSGPDGRAWFGGMPRGTARVVGRAPGFAPAASDLQEIGPDHAVEFQLPLTSGTRTVLQAFERGGQPLLGATLTARCDGGPWLPSLVLIERMRTDGGFDLGRLGRGAWEFRVSHPKVGELTQQRTIGDEASVTVVITQH
jgi:large repetitive protein